MLMVKREENQGRRRGFMAVDNKNNVVQSPRCGKRRRREPAVSVLGCGDNQQQTTDNQTACATTVKRSSRFRGVSRYTSHH